MYKMLVFLIQIIKTHHTKLHTSYKKLKPHEDVIVMMSLIDHCNLFLAILVDMIQNFITS